MISLECDRVEADFCVHCHGVWLDAGELELLLESSAKKDELLASFKEQKDGKRDRKCPICTKAMNKIFVRDEEVTLDRCPKHHGIWFDQGELQTVLNAGGFKESEKISDFLKHVFISQTP